jgi:sugar transferase (PEP-CTERM/EpsH1 system associated)
LKEIVQNRTDQAHNTPRLTDQEQAFVGAEQLAFPRSARRALDTPSLDSKAGPLRILHVINSLGLGGTERGVLKLMEGLDPKLFDQRICAIRGIDQQLVASSPVNGKVFKAGQDNSGFQFLLFRLAQVFRTYKPHIVHSRNWGSIEAIPAGWLTRMPVVIHSEHGYELDMLSGLPFRRRLLRRAFYGFCDAVFTVSRELQDYHRRQSWFPAQRIRVIPNGVDTRGFAPSLETRQGVRDRFNFPSESIVLGTVGRIVPIKDQRTLLQAAEQLIQCNLNIRVLLVGGGPGLEQLRSYVYASPYLHDRVTFLGATLHLCDVFQAMDIFVLPSISEGMSNTLLEAMSSGLACVATAVGGNSELIEEGRSGFLFAPGNVTELSQLLRMLIGQSDLRKKLATAARDRAVAHFSLDRMMQDYTELYSELAARRGLLPRR